MTTAHLRVHRFDALRPGPRLIVVGGVHGNETCGSVALERLAADLDEGRVALARGTLTLVPVANPLARALGRREGDRNLNRMLRPTAIPRDNEDRIANRLCPLLAEHETLLDLHSFHTGGEPFAMLGPEDNDGPVETFAQAAREQAFAAALGAPRVVEGWLDTYARGVKRRRERDGAGAPHADPEYGVGTTEFLRSRGGAAVTLECGQHEDPRAPEFAYRATLRALAHLRMAEIGIEPAAPPREVLRLVEVFDRLHPGDRLARAWTSFEPVLAGEPIGLRHDGTPVAAPADGRVAFPNPNATVGAEWFYFAVPSPRRL
ncbi:MAG: succinylglutamate desuccinylase/aspartoacylase family protein [Burkholderiaceae bacterium]|jgi:predicted deacylase|nr:succinylglutamate desuccinylase/aspartoacylase family protein [Burkholderiales bacterium]MCZ8103401.1 succinylglutamate desuccinylase/aspartoacylase family protein [Burkholderiales bacterium]MCZ8340392.1 succinylglutamate desuccinylase/aspartoacylase family protein [Burkholderiaceae bacterium]